MTDQQTAEKAHKDRDEELLRMIKNLSAKVDSIDAKTQEMYEIFSSVSGFNKITARLLKGIAIIGGGILGLYTFLELIKKIAR
jgi:hypothetical protein